MGTAVARARSTLPTDGPRGEHARALGEPVEVDGGDISPAVHRVVTSQGTVRWLERYSKPVSFRGRPAGLETLIDSTDRMQLEAQLKQVARLESIGRLSGGIVHDFNNLLTAILGFSELLSRGGRLEKTDAGFAEEISRSAERAAGLTRQIVESHEGLIDACSEAGVGTTFTVDLPLRREAEQAQGASTDAEELTQGRETILVVEDEAGLRRVMTLMLQAMGYTVHAVAAADEAKEILREGSLSIDAVITDVYMPGTDGMELAQWIACRHPDMGVLLMSGHIHDQAISREISDEGLSFPQKPFRRSQLGRSLRRVLKATARGRKPSFRGRS